MTKAVALLAPINALAPTGWAAYCSRCGSHLYCGTHLYEQCDHPATLIDTISHDEARRIRARYAFGKRFNPEHDTTSYRDGNSATPASASEQAQSQHKRD